VTRNEINKEKHNALYGLTKSGANQLIKDNHETWAKLPATYSQEKYLRANIQWKPNMTRGEADAITSGDKPRW
jgi:hypothetical protein